jgi:hypothetical protein
VHTHLCCWWDYTLVKSLWKSMWRFLKKLKNRSTFWSCYSIPVHESEGM